MLSRTLKKNSFAHCNHNVDPQIYKYILLNKKQDTYIVSAYSMVNDKDYMSVRRLTVSTHHNLD